MEKCDEAVMDFLTATDVGKFLPKLAKEPGQGRPGWRSTGRRSTGRVKGVWTGGGLCLVSSISLVSLFVSLCLFLSL